MGNQYKLKSSSEFTIPDIYWKEGWGKISKDILNWIKMNEIGNQCEGMVVN